MTADSARRRSGRTFGQVQFPMALGLARWELDRAVAAGLIPPAGDGGPGRWTRAQLVAALARLGDITAKIGDVPDVGGWQAAEVLAERLGVDVDRDAVVELARDGRIVKAGVYKGHRLYCGRSIAAFQDVEAFRAAAVVGRQRTSEQAADYMRIRRADLEHLVRSGWLRSCGWYKGRWNTTVLLFRTGDLDAMLTDPRVDWDAVRATPKGQPSPLARLVKQQPNG